MKDNGRLRGGHERTLVARVDGFLVRMFLFVLSEEIARPAAVAALGTRVWQLVQVAHRVAV